MMKKLFRLLLTTLCFSLLLVERAAAQVEMADKMRSEGKIYVVVSIIVIVLVGLISYLFSLDRKIKKLESLLRQKQGQTK